MRNLPTPARASSPASAEPVAPQPTIATRPLAKRRCPSTPMPWNKVWREYRCSIRPCRIWASCLKEVTSAKPQNLYYKCAPAKRRAVVRPQGTNTQNAEDWRHPDNTIIGGLIQGSRRPSPRTFFSEKAGVVYKPDNRAAASGCRGRMPNALIISPASG
jgi:hypothetical protein